MKTMKWFVMLLGLTGLVMFSSCDNDSRAEEAAEDMEEVGEDMSDAFRNEQQELRADIEEMKRDIDDKVAELENDLDGASDDASAEINEQIAKLKSWGATLDDRLDRMGDEIESGWDNFRNDVQNTLSEIERDWDDTFDNEG